MQYEQIEHMIMQHLILKLFVSQHNHLVGLKKTYLKLSFKHVDDLQSVKRELSAGDYLKHLKELCVEPWGGLGTQDEGSCFRK